MSRQQPHPLIFSESRVQVNARTDLGALAGSYPRREMACTTPGKRRSDLVVVLHSSLAAPANLMGEESPYVAWSVGRALDPRGSGRILLDPMLDALCVAFSRKQAVRILSDDRAERWWELESTRIRLVGQDQIRESFDVEVPNAEVSRCFLLTNLSSRPRRTAALVATVVGDSGPRSLAFVERYTGVNRTTLHRLCRDPFVRQNILRRHAEWASL